MSLKSTSIWMGAPFNFHPREVSGAEFCSQVRALGSGSGYGRGAAGALHKISWTQADASVRRIELKVYDPDGFWKGRSSSIFR